MQRRAAAGAVDWDTGAGWSSGLDLMGHGGASLKMLVKVSLAMGGRGPSLMRADKSNLPGNAELEPATIEESVSSKLNSPIYSPCTADRQAR